MQLDHISFYETAVLRHNYSSYKKLIFEKSLHKYILKLFNGKKWKEVHILEIYQEIFSYRKFPKYSDTQKICCNHSKIWTMWLYHRVMSQNHADRIANSVDPEDLGLHRLPRHILGTLQYLIFPKQYSLSSHLTLNGKDVESTVKIPSFRTDRPGQTVQTLIRLRSSLIRVYTVCNSLCIFWTHYSKVKPPRSTFRVTTANFRVSVVLEFLR